MGIDQDSVGFRLDVGDVPGATVIVIAGDLDIATAPQLVAAVEGLADRADPLVLDLAAVTFVDSSGIRALLDTEKAASVGGRRLALLRPAAALTRLLDLVDLRSRFVEVDELDGDGLARLRKT